MNANENEMKVRADHNQQTVLGQQQGATCRVLPIKNYNAGCKPPPIFFRPQTAGGQHAREGKLQQHTIMRYKLLKLRTAQKSYFGVE